MIGRTPAERAAWFAQLEADAQQTHADIERALLHDEDRASHHLLEDALDVIGRLAEGLDMSIPTVRVRGQLVTREDAARLGLDPAHLAAESHDGAALVCLLRADTPCPECGAPIPRTVVSAINVHHTTACSLHPANIIESRD